MTAYFFGELERYDLDVLINVFLWLKLDKYNTAIRGGEAVLEVLIDGGNVS